MYNTLKKVKERQKDGETEEGEMKDRHSKTLLRMSKQKCMNDLLGEREGRI